MDHHRIMLLQGKSTIDAPQNQQGFQPLQVFSTHKLRQSHQHQRALIPHLKHTALRDILDPPFLADGKGSVKASTYHSLPQTKGEVQKRTERSLPAPPITLRAC